MALLRRIAVRAARLWCAVFASATGFGLCALGMALHSPRREGEEAGQAPFSRDELLWMAELEDRDLF